jgi:hypothetical protein
LLSHAIGENAICPRHGNAINDVGDRQVPANSFNIIDGLLSKQSFQYASNEVYHNNTTLIPEDGSKLDEYLHALIVHDKG